MTMSTTTITTVNQWLMGWDWHSCNRCLLLGGRRETDQHTWSLRMLLSHSMNWWVGNTLMDQVVDERQWWFSDDTLRTRSSNPLLQSTNQSYLNYLGLSTNEKNSSLVLPGFPVGATSCGSAPDLNVLLRPRGVNSSHWMNGQRSCPCMVPID